MVTTTRHAAWRSGPTNGWHDDVIWYAAAIHQMRALTPRLDDFLQVYQDFQTGQLPGDQAVAGAGGHRRAVGRSAQPRLPVPGARHVRRQARLARREPCGRSARTTTGSSCPGTGPTCWSSRPSSASTSSRSAAPPTGPCRTGTTPTSLADPQRLTLPLPLQGDTLPADVTVPGVGARADGTFPNPLFNPTAPGPGPDERHRVGHRLRWPCCARTTPTSRTRDASRSAAACWRTRTTRRCSTTRPTRSASSTSSRTDPPTSRSAA